MKILSYTENGTEDIISARSKSLSETKYRCGWFDHQRNSFNWFLNIPNLLRRPIIMDSKRIPSVSTKMKFVPFCLVIMKSKNCWNDHSGELRVTMTKGNYLPLLIHHGALKLPQSSFCNQVEKAYTRARLTWPNSCKPIRHLKPLSQAKRLKSNLDKAFEKKLAVLIYQAVKSC